MGFRHLLKKNRCFAFFLTASVLAFIIHIYVTSPRAELLTKTDSEVSIHGGPAADYATSTFIQTTRAFAETLMKNISKTPKIKKPTGNHGDVVPYLYSKNFTPSYTLGNGSAHKVSIVIGIPSIKRGVVSYLFNTLRSLFHDIFPFNEDNVCVVVMLAETDQDFVESTGRKIYEKFTRQIDGGLLQVVAPNASVYPDFNKLQQTLGDSRERLKWRSKGVYDVAYLMLYCVDKADYYLMLEDDVIASKGYVEATINFISKHKDEDFVYMALANFNVIGKLFKMSDIPIWASYFLTFFVYKPIDWLMNDYVHIVSCHPGMSGDECQKSKNQKIPLRHPGLFQHIGTLSSLGGKWQLFTDSGFSRKHAAINTHKNPKAKVKTLFEAVDRDSVQTWYDDSGGMRVCYSVKPISAYQHITVTLDDLQKISRILVKTGKDKGKEKLPLNSTVLEYEDDNSIDYKQCAVFDHNGEAECRFNNEPIKNIRIRALEEITTNTWFDLIYVK